MKMSIETMPVLKVAYMRSIGMYGAANSMMMEQFKKWVKESGYEDDNTIILGIAHDNPSMVNPDTCRYDACLILDGRVVEPTDVIHVGEFEGGKYCVCRIEHTAEAVRQAWMDMFGEIQIKGYKLDGTRPILERYAAKVVAEHQCEICVPIK